MSGATFADDDEDCHGAGVYVESCVFHQMSKQTCLDGEGIESRNMSAAHSGDEDASQDSGTWYSPRDSYVVPFGL